MANALTRRLRLLERRRAASALLPQLVVVPIEPGPERTAALARLRRLEAIGQKVLTVCRHGDALDRDSLAAFVDEFAP